MKFLCFCARSRELRYYYAEISTPKKLHDMPEEVNRQLDAARKRNLPLKTPENFSTQKKQPPSPPSRNNKCLIPWYQIIIYQHGAVVPRTQFFERKDFGNLEQQNFRDIFYGPAFRELRQQWRENLPGPVCRQCPATLTFDMDQEGAFESRKIVS